MPLDSGMWNHFHFSCWETENIEEEIEKLKKLDSFLVSEPKEAILFQNKKVAFLMTNIGLVELVEEWY